MVFFVFSLAAFSLSIVFMCLGLFLGYGFFESSSHAALAAIGAVVCIVVGIFFARAGRRLWPGDLAEERTYREYCEDTGDFEPWPD